MTGPTKIEERIIVDWLAVTCKSETPLQDLLSVFNLNIFDFTELQKGALGYTRQAVFNKIKILFEGKEDMGAHLIISGQACRYLEAKGFNLFHSAFAIAEQENFKMTRLDIALDTSEDILSKVVESIEQGLYVSKSRKVSLYKTSENGQVLKTGTVYIGSRSSNLYIRIYDKALEQKREDIPWFRVEFELKKEYIIKALKLFRENISQAFFNILGSYFRPLTYRASNVTRSPTAKYWEEFCKLREKVSLYSAPAQSEISDKLDWVMTQCAGTLGLLSLAFDNTQWLEAVAERGKEKLKPSDLEILQRWQASHL